MRFGGRRIAGPLSLYSQKFVCESLASETVPSSSDQVRTAHCYTLAVTSTSCVTKARMVRITMHSSVVIEPVKVQHDKLERSDQGFSPDHGYFGNSLQSFSGVPSPPSFALFGYCLASACWGAAFYRPSSVQRALRPWHVCSVCDQASRLATAGTEHQRHAMSSTLYSRVFDDKHAYPCLDAFEIRSIFQELLADLIALLSHCCPTSSSTRC